MSWNPLAQTFRVREATGVLITKVEVFFSTKDDQAPVTCEIRPTINGVPSSYEIIASKTLTSSQVTANVATSQANMIANGTVFQFDEPVYLDSKVNGYAVVLRTNSDQYNVYVAKGDEFLIGSTEKRIGAQPLFGSLYISSNSVNWEPAQDLDLAMIVHRAKFSTAGQVGDLFLKNARLPRHLLSSDPFIFDSGESTVRVLYNGHGFNVNDTVRFTGLDSASTYGGILGSSILDSDRPIIKIDTSGFTFNADSAATFSTRAGGSSVSVNNNIQFDAVYPSIQALLPGATTITTSGRFTSGKSIAGSETRFVKPSAYTFMSINQLYEFEEPKLAAHSALENSELTEGSNPTGRSTDFKIRLGTYTDFASPIIDLQRVSLLTSRNIVDKQVDSDEYVALVASDVGASGENVPIKFVSELQPSLGSSGSKHISTPVILAQDATGIKIILGVNRPPEAEIEVYFRTATDGQILADQFWVQATATNSPAPTDIKTLFQDYEYLAGGNEGTLTSFTEFQVKVIFRSTNEAKIPVVRDLRAIALID